MSDPYFQQLFAERIGGAEYGKDTEIYKFEKIKRAKQKMADAATANERETWNVIFLERVEWKKNLECEKKLVMEKEEWEKKEQEKKEQEKKKLEWKKKLEQLEKLKK